MPREDARARAIGRYVEAEVPTATITTGPQGSFHCYGSRQRVVIIDVAFGRFQIGGRDYTMVILPGPLACPASYTIRIRL